MEGDAGGVQTLASGRDEQLHRLVDRAAVLARQRPVRPRTARDDPHEHGGAGRGIHELGDLAGGVDDEQPHAERVRLGQVVATSHRVGVHEVGCRCARVERGADLGRAGHVEPASGLGQRAQEHRVRVGLDRVVDGGARQGGRQREVARHGSTDAELEPRRGCDAWGERPGAGGPRCGHRRGSPLRGSRWSATWVLLVRVLEVRSASLGLRYPRRPRAIGELGGHSTNPRVTGVPPDRAGVPDRRAVSAGRPACLPAGRAPVAPGPPRQSEPVVPASTSSP